MPLGVVGVVVEVQVAGDEHLQKVDKWEADNRSSTIAVAIYEIRRAIQSPPGATLGKSYIVGIVLSGGFFGSVCSTGYLTGNICASL